MHQTLYVTDVIKRFGMEQGNTVDTPLDPHISLCKSGAVSMLTGVSNGYSGGGFSPSCVGWYSREEDGKRPRIWEKNLSYPIVN